MADRLDFVIYGATGYTGYYCVKVTIADRPPATYFLTARRAVRAVTHQFACNRSEC